MLEFEPQELAPLLFVNSILLRLPQQRGPPITKEDGSVVIPLQDLSAGESRSDPSSSDSIENYDKTTQSWRTNPKIAVWVIIGAIFLDSVFYSIVIPILPFYVESLGLEQIQVGILFASFPFAYLISAPICIWAVDKLGRKKSMMISVVLIEISSIGFALSNQYWLLLLCRSIQGFCSNLTWTSGMVMVAVSFKPQEQGVYLGTMFAVAGAGTLLGPFMGGLAFEFSGYDKRVPFLIVSGLLFVDGVMRSFLKDVGKPAQKSKNSPWRIFTSPKALALAFVVSVSQGGPAALEPLVPVYLADSYGLSPAWIGGLFAVAICGFVLGSLLMGWFSDKYPHWRIHAVSAAAIITAGFAALLIHTPNLLFFTLSLFIFLFLAGILNTPILPEVMRIVARDVGPGHEAAVSGLCNCAYSIGASVGAAGVSALYEVTDLNVCMYTLSGIYVFVCILVISVVLRGKIFSVPKIEEHQLLSASLEEESTSAVE
ncbi:multidrug resistance protein [Planoprotostelium fungivorum]|uniref:Multidrug resistance protein n=1 Tax=Planoprotostelium fungivorum TaxID=1890364 RepID=A0A2P6NLN5_9EUKA|nr:multidrug resistance protein [Planoprotostelium fungivorum]